MASSRGAFLAVVEATSQDAPVRASERGVAERVADGVDRTVDVTQPITCNINATIFIFFTPVLFFREFSTAIWKLSKTRQVDKV